MFAQLRYVDFLHKTQLYCTPQGSASHPHLRLTMFTLFFSVVVKISYVLCKFQRTAIVVQTNTNPNYLFMIGGATSYSKW